MDAPEQKPGSSRGVSQTVIRFVVTWLVAVLALGLWQAYGAWLLSSGGGDVL